MLDIYVVCVHDGYAVMGKGIVGVWWGSPSQSDQSESWPVYSLVNRLLWARGIEPDRVNIITEDDGSDLYQYAFKLAESAMSPYPLNWVRYTG